MVKSYWVSAVHVCPLTLPYSKLAKKNSAWKGLTRFWAQFFVFDLPVIVFITEEHGGIHRFAESS
jgi:hypothetical protein